MSRKKAYECKIRNMSTAEADKVNFSHLVRSKRFQFLVILLSAVYPDQLEPLRTGR